MSNSFPFFYFLIFFFLIGHHNCIIAYSKRYINDNINGHKTLDQKKNYKHEQILKIKQTKKLTNNSLNKLFKLKDFLHQFFFCFRFFLKMPRFMTWLFFNCFIIIMTYDSLIKMVVLIKLVLKSGHIKKINVYRIWWWWWWWWSTSPI